MLRGVAAFIFGHRAQMVSLNTDAGTNTRGHMCRPRREKGKQTQRCEWACTRSIAHKQTRYRTQIHTQTRLGSLTMKRVWNEAKACCTVGRLLTHAWTLANSHGPLLWAGQSNFYAWQKTSSCIISLSDLSLTGALALQTEPVWARHGAKPGLNALSSAVLRSVIYPD